jgi:hypothetical protein
MNIEYKKIKDYLRYIPDFYKEILQTQFNFSHSSLLLPKYTPSVLKGFSYHLMPSILSLLCLSFPTQIPPVLGSYFASLRASWVSRFVSGEMDNWKLIPYKYFRQFGKNWLIFSMNIEYKKIKDYLRYIPDFYKEILQTWIKMGGSIHFPFTISLSF